MKYLKTIKVKSVTENGEIEGYASVFDELDSCGDIVVRGAFEKNNLPNEFRQISEIIVAA